MRMSNVFWVLSFAVFTVFIIEGRSSYSFVSFMKCLVEPPPPIMFVYLHTHRDTHIDTCTQLLGSHFELRVTKPISSYSQGMPLSSLPLEP